ncbi:MAG: efflux RND transporter periplasmic adaptor subunit [Polyangiaceae bacterium]
MRARLREHERSSTGPAPAIDASPPLETELSATGYVVAVRRAKLGCAAPGRVDQFALELGDTVRARDVLVVLDASAARSKLTVSKARVAAAASRIAVARAELAAEELVASRDRALAEDGAIPAAVAKDSAARTEVLRASLRVQEAELGAATAEQADLQRGLDDYVVRAPFDGVVSAKSAEVGEFVAAGAPVLELVDVASLVVEAEVPEARLSAIQPEADCEVVLDAMPAAPLACRVSSLLPRIDRAKATVSVRLALERPPAALRENMAARVRLHRKAPAPAAPTL